MRFWIRITAFFLANLRIYNLRTETPRKFAGFAICGLIITNLQICDLRLRNEPKNLQICGLKKGNVRTFCQMTHFPAKTLSPVKALFLTAASWDRRALYPNHIKFMSSSALALIRTPPINERAELTQCSL